ncbi:MAG: dienelactone hydrolase family protein, partial [Omnitrophica WOR_2 bacterium]
MQDIRTENLEFESGHFTIPAYMARPDDEAVHPGIVTIQEFWGLVPHIKDVAERFARQGFVALAPDLYHGKSAVEPDEARKLAMELDRERAVREILSAIQHLQSLNYISPNKIGVVGWCMGGGLA